MSTPNANTLSDCKQTASEGSRRVLVVDDHELVRIVTVKKLEALGYTVCSVDSAVEAQKIIEQTPRPQIVLTDVRMPGGMNGVQLRKWILDTHPEIHVVLMSGYSDEDTDATACFLYKPYTQEQLLAALRSEESKHSSK